MASALLASRNEPHWGEPKVYMRKNPNWKTNPNPNPNPNSREKCSPRKQIYDHRSSQVLHGRHQMDESAAVALAKSDDSSSLNRKFVSLNNRKESIHGGYVSFNITAYSRKELKGLKKRLIAELEQVRSLCGRIESRELQSRSGYSATQFSGGYGGREVTSSTRPPPTSCSPEASGGKGLKQKQMMKASGSKRPPPNQLDCARDPKRLVSDPVNRKLLSSMMKKCGQLLTKLMKHKHGWIFNTPVDVVGLGLHDYNQIIKHPMDLGTVKSKLGKNLYASPLDFASDVRLTFNNALRYNPKGHEVYLVAEELQARFEEMFEHEYGKYENDHQNAMLASSQEMKQRSTMLEEMEPRRTSWNQSHAPESIKDPDRTQIPRLNSPPMVPKPASAAARAPVPVPVPVPIVQATKQMGVRSGTRKQLPKPKAKDPNKREMTFEEKQKLSLNLQSLPQEKMDQVLQIIRKGDSNLAQHGDEIEVDIEYVDKDTLWELERFVCYYKKALSNMKKQAIVVAERNPISAAAEDNKQSTVDEIPEAAAIGAKKSKKGGGGEEEEVDIGEEMPASNFPPVEIEKEDAGHASRSSSSSSSSSSDNSSSSDSDSGSSSGSDSDDDEAQSPGRESSKG